MLKRVLICLGVFIGIWIVGLVSILTFIRFHDFSTKEHIVAVLDSGVKSDHNMLQGHVIAGFNFVDWNRDTTDDEGHGTHVSGIIIKQSPSSKILPLKVLNKEGSTRVNTIFAMYYAIIKGADVLNISLGGGPPSLLFQWTINLASKKGIIIVASTGNEGINEVHYPAKFKNVIGVGNSNSENNIAKESNFGEGMDFLAPGVNIESADIKNETSVKSGTSMSAAYVSGVVSYLQVNEHIKGLENMMARLKEGSNTIGNDKAFEIVDKEKIIAQENKSIYSFISSPPRYVKDGNVTFHFNTLHADEVGLIYDYQNQLIQKNEDVNQGMNFNLPYGWNRFTFWIKNEVSYRSANIDILFDNQSPIVNIDEVTIDGVVLIKIVVKDEALKHLKIVEFFTGIVRDYSMKDKKEFTAYIDSKETNFTIFATDMLNQVTKFKYVKNK